MPSKPSTRAGRNTSLLSLLPYLRKYRWKIAAGTLMVLFTNVAAVLSPWILRYAIDELQIEVTRERLFFYAGLFVGLTAVEGVFRFLMRKILIGVSRLIEYDLENNLAHHLQSLSQSFYQKNSTGDLMARATNDLSAVRSVLGPGIMYSLNTVFTTVLTVGFLVRIEYRLALLTLIPLIVVSICVKYFGKRIHDRFEQIQQQFSVLTSMAQENITGVRVVKAYNQEEAFIERFAAGNSEYRARSMELVKIWGVFNPLLTLLLGLSSVALLWLGGNQVIRGQITLGELVAFMAYLAMLTWPTIALGWVINVVERGAASMGRLNEILETKPEIADQPSLSSSGELSGEIEAKSLTFGYNGKPVLKDLSFQIPAGSTLAIVGSTGSGKTTLANLICRLYKVDDGKLFLDGHDINAIPLSELRKAIGYVPQDTFLFSETVAQNIAFGAPGAGHAAIVEAARVSNILPDIEDFPQQFETRVGERGVTLSGGQKQRIAISRALLTDPRIVILDDSLSSVDTYTEEQILTRLQQETSDRTAILISHRISTVKTADQIFVMDDGQIVERGTHEQLLAAHGVYFDLYEKQLLREELGME